jgi:hypothetical protein
MTIMLATSSSIPLKIEPSFGKDCIHIVSRKDFEAIKKDGCHK